MDRNFLRNNVIFFSRLGFGLDPVTQDENGDPVIYDKTFSQIKFHKDFYARGVKIHSFILNSGWVGDGVFNYSMTDATMDAALDIGPDAKFIPRIKLNVPIEWCKNNPEEVFVYFNGPRDAEGIRNLVGTPEHDYIGYESPNGIYMAPPKYNRPNINGKICLQSFCSDKWLDDAKIALQKLILHLEEKYPNRIIGYHIAYGTSGETMMWGRIGSKYGDYGITARRKFADFLETKYGLDTPLPSPTKRYDQKETLTDFLRIENEVSRYYDEFTDMVNSDAIIHFCKAVKEIAPNRLTGVFYGYFMGVRNIAYTGHTDIEKLLNSPYVDFFAAPKSYSRCRPGEPSGEYGCSQSVNLKKVWLDECDVRTHLAKDVPEEWLCHNLKETKNALTRELVKNLTHDSGLWFMDLGGNWYDSEEMMSLVEELVRINEAARKKEHQSTSDVLMLVDEKSIVQTSISYDILSAYTSEFICNAKMTGFALDVFRISDINKIDLSKYKLIVFLNTLKLSLDEIEYIKSHSNAALCFNYAAGCLYDCKLSLENTKAVTGFSIKEQGHHEYDFPKIEAIDDGVIIKKDEKGELLYQKRDERLHFINTIPFLDTDPIKKIGKLAGCHFYTDSSYTLYADNRMLALIANEKKYAGTVDLGVEREWREAYTNKRGFGRYIDVDMQPYDTAVFIFE